MTQATQQFVTAETSASPWQVVLEGDLLEQAREAVEELASGLAMIPADQPADTLADLALFYGYLAQVQNDELNAERALQYLNAAINKVGNRPLLPWLIGGYPQVGWVITQLA